MAAHQAPLSLGFSRQEHWSGLPFPSPMHESEKWKGSRSVLSNSSWPHGLQPTSLLRPWLKLLIPNMQFLSQFRWVPSKNCVLVMNIFKINWLNHKPKCKMHQKNWQNYLNDQRLPFLSCHFCISNEIKPVNPKGNQSWIFTGRTDAEAEAPILWPPTAKNWLTEKDPDAGQDWRQEEKGMTEDEMVGWHHWLNGHEFEQAPGVGDEQGSLVCCSPWGRKKLDTTDWVSFTHSFT